jgi:hypothetical protein
MKTPGAYEQYFFKTKDNVKLLAERVRFIHLGISLLDIEVLNRDLFGLVCAFG